MVWHKWSDTGMNSLICTILPSPSSPLAFPFLSSPPLFDPDLLPSLFFILASPVVGRFVAQVLSPGSPGEPQSNLSLSARESPSVLLVCVCVCVWENCICTQRLSICALHESPAMVIRRYLWRLVGHLLPADSRRERLRGASGRKREQRMVERWQEEERNAQSFPLSAYYQLAFQAGWGCHGDVEGGLQWEQSDIPVGWGTPNVVA